MILVVNDDANKMGVLRNILGAAGIDVYPSVTGILPPESRSSPEAGHRDESFGDLADQAPVGIWVMGTDQHLLFHNKRAAAFLGAALPRILENGWTSIVHPRDLQKT